jgi:phage tail protein X
MGKTNGNLGEEKEAGELCVSKTYTTSSGDTWDAVALAVYGSEKHVEYLMANNQNIALLSTLIFDAGVVLNTPALTSTAKTVTNQPPWRANK